MSDLDIFSYYVNQAIWRNDVAGKIYSTFKGIDALTALNKRLFQAKTSQQQ